MLRYPGYGLYNLLRRYCTIGILGTRGQENADQYVQSLLGAMYYVALEIVRT